MTDQSNVAVFWPRPMRALASFFSNLIGPELHGERHDATAPISNNWLVILFALGSISILLVALAHGAGRRLEPVLADILYWCGITIMVFPMACRAAWPVLARGERIMLLLMLGETLVIYRYMYTPSQFTQFDEMLHWITAQDMLLRQQLFLDNALLPISPFYPAMEIVTTAICNLGGIGLFPAAVLVVMVLRGIFMIGLFLFFEKITDSARIAGLACLVYMSCSTFVMFNASFAYETLGIVLFVLVMLAEAEANRSPYTVTSIFLPLVFLATLAVTHHLTAFGCALYLVGVAVIQAVQRGQTISRRAIAGVLLLVGLGFPILWVMVSGNPLVGYLGPVIENGLESVFDKISGQPHSGPGQARELFVAADGRKQPLLNILISICAPLFLALTLSTGFFRSLALKISRRANGWWRLWQVLRREWTDSRVILLTVGAFTYPISLAFRFTTEGWEIGNRMGTFAFFAVGLVVAISLVHYWQTRATKLNLALTSLMIGTIILGGVLNGSGYRPIRATYLVSADPDSIETMGIEAAEWTKEWLGPGHRFVADRVNRTLLSTHGDQNVVSSLSNKYPGVNAPEILLSRELTGSSLSPIRQAKVRYVLVDMRLTSSDPVLGHYVEKGEKSADVPVLPSSLLKFEDTGASRIFDNGYILIYDVSVFYEEP